MSPLNYDCHASSQGSMATSELQGNNQLQESIGKKAQVLIFQDIITSPTVLELVHTGLQE